MQLETTDIPQSKSRSKYPPPQVSSFDMDTRRFIGFIVLTGICQIVVAGVRVSDVITLTVYFYGKTQTYLDIRSHPASNGL